MRVLLTGATGRLGKWVTRELYSAGYDVTMIDRIEPANEESSKGDFLEIDLTDQEQTRIAVRSSSPEAIVSLAAIPLNTESTYSNNTRCDCNILQAAAEFHIQKVVLAGSECVYGFPSAKILTGPLYLPVDENHPRLPQDGYGCSKFSTENYARAMLSLNPDMQIVCLRLSRQIAPDELSQFKNRQPIPSDLKGLYGYIDMRDTATAFRLAIEKNLPGFTALNIDAADTCSRIPSLELAAKDYPGAERRSPLPGYASLFNTARAREALDWAPKYSWRDGNDENR
jgi:nucleoside-diphosphate-sugar epimerase